VLAEGKKWDKQQTFTKDTAIWKAEEVELCDHTRRETDCSKAKKRRLGF
jgi:hypothetical protein